MKATENVSLFSFLLQYVKMAAGNPAAIFVKE